MRLILSLFLLVILSSCKQTTQTKHVSMREDVMYLASDSLKGRATGMEGEKMAADYLVKRFQELGIQAKGEDGYFQDFIFKPSSNPHEEASFATEGSDGTETGRNVIGYIDNQASKTIIIGAHFDHLGMGGQGSLYRGEEPAIHNGADDNASGVAVMLQLAERLKSVENVMTNYLFIGFSGEELGLLGSNYFAKHPTIDLSTVDVMINMDMVGRLNTENTLAVHGVGTSPTFKQLLFANNDQGFTIAEHESGIGPSDHTSFYLEDIPVLHFFTGQHEDYHKPSDDFDKLNYEGMEKITQYIYNIVMDLDDDPKLAFRKTKNESEETPRFKVGLGVVPDYLFTGEGMRIDGISEDKAAQKAGLQRGDIVKKMGDSTVTDMMSYMRALSAFEAGQKTVVTIDRNGERLEVEVEF
ncbi:MAG TPA: M28 family peptidase [Flavobacteriaceae bacterium]|nr:M28 family peptidase [Flavobacteriaceae bacterium]MCB9213900.1 M28 family peptidase [Alteromonas sp.]HPF11115.1 M28 family peptidase [Flavobacteriaceae bacterium]HQU21217.1 M28 family peptidase [Flavobacteriaceae bacterium]HQU65689.1 M28 family peptidase [Flavobacteriaceae bacterium]